MEQNKGAQKRLTSPIVRIRSAERDNGMRQPLAAQCLQIFCSACRKICKHCG